MSDSGASNEIPKNRNSREAKNVVEEISGQFSSQDVFIRVRNTINQQNWQRKGGQHTFFVPSLFAIEENWTQDDLVAGLEQSQLRDRVSGFLIKAYPTWEVERFVMSGEKTVTLRVVMIEPQSAGSVVG